MSNLISAMRAIAAPRRRGGVPAVAMKAMLEPWVARIDARFRLVCASIDPDLLLLPGGSLLAVLFSLYANIKLLLPVSFGGLPARRAPARRMAVYLAAAWCIGFALLLHRAGAQPGSSCNRTIGGLHLNLIGPLQFSGAS